jgi:peptidoglycan hydrolase CwlO-like protein
LEVFGFINGTTELSMLNITDNNFFLNNTSKEYVNSTYVPNWVWGVTFGEITMTYNATVESFGQTIVTTFPDVMNGFPMTQVENTYLEALEAQNTILQAQLESLNESFQQLTNLFQNLTNTFAQLNQNYTELYQNYTSAKGSVGDLDNTQHVATVLAVTTIVFLVTTVYLVMRRPKEAW